MANWQRRENGRGRGFESFARRMLTNERRLASVDAERLDDVEVGLVRNTPNARDISSAYSNIPATVATRPAAEACIVQGRSFQRLPLTLHTSCFAGGD